LLEAGINAAAELGAGPVIVHPGRITAPGEIAGPYWPLLVEGVARLVHYAAGRGLTVSLEVMEHIPREFFIRPEDTGRLIKEVNAPNLSITFDAAHVPWPEEPLAYLKRMSGVRHIHLSDANEQQFHLALGQGKRDFTSLMRYLRDQLDVPVAIEGRLEFERTTTLAAQNKAVFDNLLS
jgi:sugar phosphate isomerase/epimerase